MKTDDIIPIEVLRLSYERLDRIKDAAAFAQRSIETWDELDSSLGKARLPAATARRIREAALAVRRAVGEAQSLILNPETWLESWTLAGQARVSLFGRVAGYQVDMADVRDPAYGPQAKAMKASLDPDMEWLLAYLEAAGDRLTNRIVELAGDDDDE